MVVSLINKRVYFLHIFGGFDKNGQGPLKIASMVYRYFTLVVCCMVVFIKRGSISISISIINYGLRQPGLLPDQIQNLIN